ncbi:hypothetical protein UA75_28310 [Actinoalloteichus sp. GBA129-24]|uniref:Uncharacterized protein n=2 Tax=Pseudonocardiaceae TaxID=2070 RepID=A0AAC9PUY4_9PSEU|nr:hypothetical protein UA74_27770 [Actinoalloteichus fjordicus]APU23633.1 hypothetical protein UA75_28310 [Actinoalloteichus sp. GBA129-24]
MSRAWKTGRLDRMDSVIHFLAVIVTLVGLVAAVGNGGYLAMLNAAAKKRAGGGPVTDYVKGKLPQAGGIAAAALLALLFTNGSVPLDILAIVVGAGSGVAATNALNATRKRYQS